MLVKLMFSNLSTAKKSRLSVNEAVDNFLKGIMGTQARSSFFDEVRTFTKDQQMITCTDGHRKYFSISDEGDPSKLVKNISVLKFDIQLCKIWLLNSVLVL